MAINDTTRTTILGAINERLIGIWFAPLIGSDIMVSLRRQQDGSLIVRGRRKIFAHGATPAERQVFQKVFAPDEQEKAEGEILTFCNKAVRGLAEMGLAEPGTKVTVMLMRDYANPAEFTSAFVQSPGLTLINVDDGNVINPSPGFEVSATESPVETSSEVDFAIDKNLVGESDQGTAQARVDAWLRELLESGGAKIVSIEAKSPRWVRAVVDFPGQGTKVVTADVVDRPLSDGRGVTVSGSQVDAMREAGSEVHVMFASSGKDAVTLLTQDVFAYADRDELPEAGARVPPGGFLDLGG